MRRPVAASVKNQHPLHVTQVGENVHALRERQHHRFEVTDARLAYEQHGIGFLRSGQMTNSVCVFEDHQHYIPNLHQTGIQQMSFFMHLPQPVLHLQRLHIRGC